MHDEGRIAAVVEPKCGDQVFFLGATTGKSLQTVVVEEVDRLFPWGRVYRLFELAPAVGYDDSQGGDSGGPVLKQTADGLMLLGLVTGSDDDEDQTFCTRASIVEADRGVRFVTGFTPIEATVKERIDAAITWVTDRMETADVSDERVMKMYPAFALAMKRPNAAECDRSHNLGGHYRGSKTPVTVSNPAFRLGLPLGPSATGAFCTTPVPTS